MPNGRKILIVDDDKELVLAATLRLQIAGYKCSAVYNGGDALGAVQRSAPDAILLDVRMPGMDGLTVLKLLQLNHETSEVPVIMFSASLSDQRKALGAGARFFLAKPYNSEELLHVLREVIAPVDAGETYAAQLAFAAP